MISTEPLPPPSLLFPETNSIVALISSPFSLTYAKTSWACLQWGKVEHNIGKQECYLPNNCVPVTKSRLKSLELENQEMKLTICSLNAELADAKNMLADSQLLVSSGSQLSKLKSIRKNQHFLMMIYFMLWPKQ